MCATKDDYDKKLQELKDKQYRLSAELDEHRKANHEHHLHLLKLSRRVKQIFDSSEVNEKRGLIKFLLQNPFVSEKKLVFELRKPFDMVLQLARCPTVLAWWHSFRTFDWAKALPVPEVTIKHVNYLCSLV